VKPDISEFSYGYALTEELIHHHGHIVSAAPHFPSLLEEGNVGYDVRLDQPGLPLFLQFKLSDCMVRDTAKEISQHGLFPPGTHFYRMHLRRPPSRQHQLLLALEGGGNEVFYAAPGFDQPDELDDAYLSHGVRTRSVFIRPSWIGPLPDNHDHHVAFLLGGPQHFLSAQPKPIRYEISYAAFSAELASKLASVKSRLEEQLAQLPDKLIAALKQHPESPRDGAPGRMRGRIGRDREAMAQRIKSIQSRREEVRPRSLSAYLARTLFDCELFLVGEPIEWKP